MSRKTVSYVNAIRRLRLTTPEVSKAGTEAGRHPRQYRKEMNDDKTEAVNHGISSGGDSLF